MMDSKRRAAKRSKHDETTSSNDTISLEHSDFSKPLNACANKQATSLTAALFGAAGADSTGSSLFDSSPEGNLNKAVQQRISTNLKKQQYLQPPTPNGNPQKPSTLPSVEQVLTQRRKQAASPMVAQVTMPAPYPHEKPPNDTSDNFQVSDWTPPEEQVQEIARILKLYGLAVMKNVLPGPVLDELSQHAQRIYDTVRARLKEKNIDCFTKENEPQEPFRFVEVASRCVGRMDVRYQVSQEPFSKQCIVENPSIMAVLEQVLGSLSSLDPAHAPKLIYAGLIYSMPHSHDQPWHQDGMPLFPEHDNNSQLPPYAINVFFPLSDFDGSVEAGPTEFLPSSHLMSEKDVMTAKTDNMQPSIDVSSSTPNPTTPVADIISPILNQGDALLYDYRVCHRGTSNLTKNNANTGRVRQILYLMYARPWFNEHLNFGTEPLFSVREYRQGLHFET